MPAFTGVPRGAGPQRDRVEGDGPDEPGEVIWVIMQVRPARTVPFTVPDQRTRTGGNEYVWHCHILEHEEHDMMRPLVVT